MKIKLLEEHMGEEAKDLILQGFQERFGFIDEMLNPDLNDIWNVYRGASTYFFTGHEDNELICTGAVKKEQGDCWRIVRMSVRKNHRRKGIGKKMLQHLETIAVQNGANQLVLETNSEWKDAIYFYKINGFVIYLDEGSRLHFKKDLKN